MFTRKSIPRLFRIRLPGGIAARLAIAMYGLTLLMILALVGIIAVFIRERFASSTDSDLMHHAHALQVRLINEERFAADDALTIARLDGLDNAVAADDAATMARLVLPLKVSRELDSIYIVDSSLRVLLSMGESMTDGNALAHLPLIQRCFEDKAASSPLELNGSIWLVAAAAHVVPSGNPDAVVLVGKHLDGRYLRSLRDALGPEIAVVRNNTAAYSFSTPPSELSVEHLRTSITSSDVVTGPLAYHSMDIAQVPQRVVAVKVYARDGTPITGYLFQPTTAQRESLQLAIFQVAMVGVFVLALGSLLVYLYARSVTRPLTRLSQAAQAIAGGNLDLPVQVEGDDETGLLARSFENMRERVRDMLAARQRWNAELEDKVRAKTAELSALVMVRDRLLQQTIQAQEEERRRVARELHDETCQSLTALLTNLAVLQTLPPEAVKAQLGTMRTSTVETLKEVNRIVLDLRPTLLDDYGLMPALSWYAEQRLKGSGISVTTSTSDDMLRLPPIVETVLFRVGQEAITNVARHAAATHVAIRVCRQDSECGPAVCLQVEDDGRGFDVKRFEQCSNDDRAHLGLLGIRERVGLVGGTIDVRSTPGGGTCISATVPCDTYPVSTSDTP